MVRSLFVVGIGAALEQQTRESGMLRDSRCTVDRGFEHRPGIRMIDHFDPASIGAGTGIEQSASSADKRVGARAVEPEISREAQMSEWVPTVGSALGCGAGGIMGEEGADGGFV